MMAIVLISMSPAQSASAATRVSKNITAQVTTRVSGYKMNATAKVTCSKTLWWYNDTTVTIKNTGRYTCDVYEISSGGLVYWKFSLGSNCSRTISVKGSSKTATIGFMRVNGRNTSVSVSVSKGSVS